MYKDKLEQHGFHQGRPGKPYDEVYIKRIAGENCRCNERPPSIIVGVYYAKQIGYHSVPQTFEIEMAGETDKFWIKMTVYAFKDLDLELFEKRLTNIWAAANGN